MATFLTILLCLPEILTVLVISSLLIILLKFERDNKKKK